MAANYGEGMVTQAVTPAYLLFDLAATCDSSGIEDLTLHISPEHPK